MTTTDAPPARTTAGAEGRYRWVYLWQWPIRAMHWAAAASIVVLAVTGFYIGRPYFMTGDETTPRFIMGWMRFAHFAAAGVLVATAIVRVYWLIVGNRYVRFAALFPIRRRDWINLFRVVQRYLFIHPEHGPHYLGHHPLQQLSYTGLYGLAAFQVLTGFMMYGLSNPDGLIYAATAWAIPLFGGAQWVRFLHHVVTWVFIIFIPTHVYLSLRADIMDRQGAISSIFSGGRFVRSDVDYEDD